MAYRCGMRTRLLLPAIVAVVLAAGGCGGSDTSSTQDWADGLCSAISTWTSSLQTTVSGLQGNFNKASLTSAVDDAQSSTKDFTDSLDELGTPDTDAGQQARDAVDGLSSQVKADIEAIQKAVEDASGVTGLLNAANVIKETITKAGSQVTSTLTTLQGLDAKGELEQGFKAAPSCQKLSGGS
jgi:hypothetical protein